LESFELYNLRTDIGETTDRAASEPEQLATFSALLRKNYHEVRDETPIWSPWQWERYEGRRIRAHRLATAGTK
jgi:hypothetical protein